MAAALQEKQLRMFSPSKEMKAQGEGELLDFLEVVLGVVRWGTRSSSA